MDFINVFENGDSRKLYTVGDEFVRVFKIVGSTTGYVDNGNKVYIRYANVATAFDLTNIVVK